VGQADIAEAAVRAVGRARGADEGAVLHEGLIVVAWSAGGDGKRAEAVDLSAISGAAGIQAEDAREEAACVGVDRGMSKAEGDGGDGAGGVLPYSGESEKVSVGVGEAAGVVADDGAGGGVDATGAGVVAEPGPEAEDVVEGGGGEGPGCGERFQEALEEGDDTIHLGLLEHDLADEDVVGLSGAAPGEVALGAAEPAE